MKATQIFNDLAEDYDGWFDENLEIYQAEAETLAAMTPKTGRGLEIGIGTGRFAVPLGIRTGIDPAHRALRYALARDIHVCQAIGERLPFASDQFDFVLLNTVDPFVLDIGIILNEIYRVLKGHGRIIVGMIDKDSPLGQDIDAGKEKDPFFRIARFHSADEMILQLRNAGFSNVVCRQTLMHGANADAHDKESFDNAFVQIKDGFGEGGFIALRAEKLARKAHDKNRKINIEKGKDIPS